MNILTAIENIVISPVGELRSYYTSRNRANNMGDALEEYVKDVFAGTVAETDEQKRLERFEQVFSYQGNQNNPPDVIVRQGDAIEVKKIESAGSALALNSSYPKAKLFADSPMITATCRACEQWDEKDILYSVGVVNGNNLKRLFFVYGVDYAASAEIYERIRGVIRSGVNSIPDVEFAHDTKELGRVNRVDPLGITYLRIRGMWGIENPARVFSYIYTPSNAQFEFTAIINTDKYNSFSNEQRMKLELLMSTNYNFKDNTSHKGGISDVKIKMPDNPSVLKSAKLITFCR
jgi:hypothetical protein